MGVQAWFFAPFCPFLLDGKSDQPEFSAGAGFDPIRGQASILLF